MSPIGSERNSMDDQRKLLAEKCIRGAETNTMTFPQIVSELSHGGFESYSIDLRRGTATYYLPDGDSIELTVKAPEAKIASSFDGSAIQAAIREAQQQVSGYTYTGFCNKAALAGCASYFVSFSGRRVVYLGRTGDLHVEMMP
jgi:uncharacterized protein YbcV (DUF1398 family)